MSRLRVGPEASPCVDDEGVGSSGTTTIEPEIGALDTGHRRYAPALCKSRLLRPILCLFIGCGRPPEMTERQWTVVSAVTAAGFFSHFDDDLLPLCLRQLQSSLDIPEAQVCLLLSLIGSGKAGAVVMSILADVLGRRHVFFASIVVFTVCSVLSAFQKTLWGFAALQLAARIFLAGKDSMANVYLVEETDPMTRGWVMGTYSSVAVTGGGAAVILFGAIGGTKDGWRYLYGLAAVQLVFLAPLWRRLPEKTRGSASDTGCREVGKTAGGGEEAKGVGAGHAQLEPAGRGRWWVALRNGLRPLRLLVTAYPRRAAACLFVNFNNGFALTPSGVMKIKHLQDAHGMSPRGVSVVAISSGLVALVIFPLLGRLSDSKGRRLLLCCVMLACPAGVLAFYNAPGNTYLPFYILQMMGGFALNVLQTTFFSETFPASHRCTAQGMMMLCAVLGGVAGLASESFLYTVVGSHAKAVSTVLLPSFASPIVVHCCLPETAGKDLDEIAPERAEEEGKAGAEAVELLEAPKGAAVPRKSNSGLMVI